jgi:hypothetical protein
MTNAYRLHGLPYSMHQGIVARVRSQVGNSRHDTDGPQIGGSTILDERKRSRLVLEILPSMWWAQAISSGTSCSQNTPNSARLLNNPPTRGTVRREAPLHRYLARHSTIRDREGIL